MAFVSLICRPQQQNLKEKRISFSLPNVGGSQLTMTQPLQPGGQDTLLVFFPTSGLGLTRCGSAGLTQPLPRLMLPLPLAKLPAGRHLIRAVGTLHLLPEPLPTEKVLLCPHCRGGAPGARGLATLSTPSSSPRGLMAASLTWPSARTCPRVAPAARRPCQDAALGAGAPCAVPAAAAPEYHALRGFTPRGLILSQFWKSEDQNESEAARITAQAGPAPSGGCGKEPTAPAASRGCGCAAPISASAVTWPSSKSDPPASLS